MNNKRVLILNKDFQPIKIVSWQKAFIKIFTDSYSIISFYDDFVSSGHDLHRIPSVMILKKYVNLHNKKSRKITGVQKKHIFFRDKNTCQYCEKTFNTSLLTLDHVTPKSKGGRLEYTNLVTACGNCNTMKSDRTCTEAKMFPVHAPRDFNRFDVYKYMFSNLTEIEVSWKPYFSHFVINEHERNQEL
jgi:5-methylcytosine-specific restriction endonuclease McrA